MSNPTVPMGMYLFVSAILFATGVAGFCLRRNVLVLLMCVELMFTAAALVFVAGARAHLNMTGQAAAVFLIALAAAEVAVGLAIVVAVFHNRRSVDIDTVSDLKG